MPTNPDPERRLSPAPAAPGVFTIRIAWATLFGGALAFALAFRLLDIAMILARPLAILVAAIVIAEALGPVVTWLARRMPRGLAVALVYLGLLLIIAAVAALLLPAVVEQTQTLAERVPDALDRAAVWLDWFERRGGGQLLDTARSQLTSLAAPLAMVPITVLSSAAEVVLIVALSAYWLAVAPSLRRFVLSLVPDNGREHAGDVLREMGETMGGYVRGALLNALIIGGLTYVGLLIIGLEYAVVLALLAGLLEVVPILGPIIAAIPAIAIALLDSPGKALVVLAFYTGLQQLEGNIVTPVVMRSQSHIPQPLILFAIFAGGTVGGILGALVAIPLAGAIQVLVVRVGAPAMRRWTGARPPSDDQAAAGGTPGGVGTSD